MGRQCERRLGHQHHHQRPGATLSGQTPTVYLQNAVPGDPVLFDDAATGTTTVNLTTILSPSGITVNNSSKDYTFTGSGGLSGPTRLNKNGTRTLTLFSNAGTNDFTGAVAINDGKGAHLRECRPATD